MKNEPLGPGNPINKPPNDSDLGFTSESRPYKRSYVNFSLPMRDIDKWAFSKKCLYASYPLDDAHMVKCAHITTKINSSGSMDLDIHPLSFSPEWASIKGHSISGMVVLSTNGEIAKAKLNGQISLDT